MPVFSPRTSSKLRYSHGFTLIELMVAVAVMAILVSAAVPSFTSVFNGNRLTGIANELAASLQSARMEALRRGQRVVVCSSADGASCVATPATDSWPGWLAFVDTDADNVLDAGEAILRYDRIQAPMEVRASPAISGGNSRVVFRPDGLAYTDAGLLLQANLSPCLVTTHPVENVRDVGVTFGSRVIVTRRNGAGACTAPVNP